MKYIILSAFIFISLNFVNAQNFEQAEKVFTLQCAACHGGQMQAYVDREWKYGSTKEDLFETIKYGRADVGMPAWDSLLTDNVIEEMVAYIQDGIKNVDNYKFKDEFVSGNFAADKFSYHLDTVFMAGKIPWGFTFLPEGGMLVTDRSGTIYHTDQKGKTKELTGVPACRAEGQGGILDIIVHPDHSKNKLVYFSYSAIKKENGTIVSTTVVERAVFDGKGFTKNERIFEALPWVNTTYHYGSRLLFDRNGYLFITVGDRGKRDIHPQNLEYDCGKVHRVLEDGTIPSDNPFKKSNGTVSSVYSYGHRNPQGMDLHPVTGQIWTNEHGPRGGDEINIIKKGVNYGWPIASRGLNYNMTKYTDFLEKEGMEPAVLYWIPSIAPSGMAFIDSDKYPGWKNQLLAGSLRFKYLNLCFLNGNEVVKEEQLLKNIGRVRDVKIGPDGYIYVAVENPGRIVRLIPGSK